MDSANRCSPVARVVSIQTKVEKIPERHNEIVFKMYEAALRRFDRPLHSSKTDHLASMAARSYPAVYFRF